MKENKDEEENISEGQDESEPLLPFKNTSKNQDGNVNKTSHFLELKKNSEECNDISPLHYKKIRNPRMLSESSIRSFISKYLFFLIIFTIELLFPEFLIFFTKEYINYSSIFNESWFFLLVLIGILLILLLIVYYTKEKIITVNLNILVPIFILYLFLVLLIYTLIGFYSINFFLCVSIIQFTTFLFLFSTIKIDSLYYRPLLSLFISYLIITLGFIFYIIISGIHYLGLFIYLMCFMILIYYIIFGLKLMYIDFINSNNFHYNENIPILIIVLGIMNSNIDIFIRAFKSKDNIKNTKLQ